MFDALAGAPLNHLLRANGWAREALKPHAGKVVRFHCPPFDTGLAVRDSGEVAPAPAGAIPDLVLTLSPGLLPTSPPRSVTRLAGLGRSSDMA